MRSLFAIVSLAIIGVSITLEYAHLWFDSLADSRLCRAGLCRYDQVFAAIDADGMGLRNVSALLNLDPSNPLVWCTYAELLSAAGHVPEAASAFGQAVSLGPGMSPVLMRSANFDFAQGRVDHGLAMTNRILRQTDAFDQVLFSYLTYSGLTVSRLAGMAVPAAPRAARSWFSWLRVAGSDEDLIELWSWMRQNRLLDQKSAMDFAWTFWQRKAFTTAQDVWSDWLGPLRGGYLHPQRLANVRFQYAPNGSPFDWTFIPAAGVAIRRNDGLEIRFAGTKNIAFANVRQFTTVSRGHYRFSAQISTEDLTTDQGLLFHIFDPVNPGRLNVESSPAKGTVARSWITREVSVPPGTQALQIQIERRPSQKFDNKFGGALHVYQVSLLPVR
jgi:hypothetical protein